jgi:CRP-like cAMP-binding protein
MRHFGLPLVASVYDFGRNGKRPSHPELLDWLAVDFMDSGWSVKHLHRLIVTSNAYRMQSKPSTAAATNLDRDHDNRWVWHFPPRRLEAEAVRDSVLAVSGELDAHLGGQVLENTLEGKSHRRSLYFAVYPEGGGHLKMLSTFDAPDPCDCYRRSESIVPQQALLMTNSQLMLDASRLLARRLSAETGPAQASEAAFVVAAFEQVLSRRPTTAELAACLQFLHKQRNVFLASKLASTKGEGTFAPSLDPVVRSRESLVRALFSHDDFVTLK